MRSDLNSLTAQAQASYPTKAVTPDLAPIKATTRDIEERLTTLLHKLALIEDSITGPSPNQCGAELSAVPPDHVEAVLDRISGKLALALNHAERIQKQLV